MVHFVRGAYGEGKSHFLNYLEDLSRDRGWATSHVECRQDKIELDRFESVYPKIVQKLRLAPDSIGKGADMPEEPARRLLDSWAERALKEAGYVKEYVMKPFEVEIKLFETLQTKVMRINLNGDFQRVLSSYPRAVMRDDYSAMSDLAGWLRGEVRDIHIPSHLLSKPGQRVHAPGIDKRLVRATTIRRITAASSLEVFRGLLWLLKQCGYKGLLLSVDEVEQIARLRTYMNRDRALQTLREFVDNTDGDIGLQYIAIYFAATPAMFDDEKYFRSYDALATRIEPVSKEINWRSPVIDLEKTMLSRKQLSWVASRIRWIYGLAYGSIVSNGLSETELEKLVDVVDQSRYRVAKPRLLCRVVVDTLDRLRQGGTIGKAEQMVSDTAAALARDQEA